MLLENCLQIVDYYHNVENESNKILSIIPYKEQNIKTEIPLIAPLIVEAGSLIDTIYRSKCDTRKLFNYYCDDYSVQDLSVIFINNPLISISPFEHCFSNKVYTEPQWWNVYNLLKHNRLENINKSNIENLVFILCALFLVISQDQMFFEALLINDYIRMNYNIDYIKKYLDKIYCEQKQNRIKEIGIETEMFYTEIGLYTSLIDNPTQYRSSMIKTKYLYRYWQSDY